MFEQELKDLINKHSAENASDTPDFILASYMNNCLLAFEDAVQEREVWYGRKTASADPIQDAVETARGGDAPTELNSFA